MAGHKTLTACVLTLAILGFAPHVDAASLTLAWDHSTSSNAAGYLVSYGTQSGKYTTSVKAGYVTSVVINGLTEGTTVNLYPPDSLKDGDKVEPRANGAP